MNTQLNTEATATAEKIELLAYRSEVDGKSYIGVYNWVDLKDPETLEAYKAEIASKGYTGLEYMSWDQYSAIEAQENLARYNVNKPVAISSERYDEMLNVLPPERWQRGETVDIFMCCEGITGRLYSFYVRLKSSKQYFEVNADVGVSYSDLTKWCLEA